MIIQWLDAPHRTYLDDHWLTLRLGLFVIRLRICLAADRAVNGFFPSITTGRRGGPTSLQIKSIDLQHASTQADDRLIRVQVGSPLQP